MRKIEQTVHVGNKDVKFAWKDYKLFTCINIDGIFYSINIKWSEEE